MTTVTVRPTSDGALLECRIKPTTPTTHYDKVYETTPNDATDYVAGQSTASGVYRDSYGKGATGIPPTSTISAVRIYNRVYGPPANELSPYTQTLLRNAEGSLAYGPQLYADTWTTEYTEYTKSPFTGVDWTVDEIEGLQIGCVCQTIYESGIGYNTGACSTVWLEIDYTPPAPAVTPRGDGLTWIIA